MDNFLLAAIPEPFAILGQRLLPLSIGRMLWLQRFGCDPVTDLERLVKAVIICSHPVAEISAAFHDPELKVKLDKWADSLGQFDLAQKIDLFRDYMAEHTSRGPVVLEDETSGSSPDAPWLQHLTITLCSKLGYSRAETLELPYSLALWDYYTFWENQGQANILGEQRRSMHDLANAMHAKTIAALEKQEPAPTEEPAKVEEGAIWI